MKEHRWKSMEEEIEKREHGARDRAEGKITEEWEK